MGIIVCKVTSSQHRHSEIAGCLEIPCMIRFTADTAMIKRLKSLLQVIFVFLFRLQKGRFYYFSLKNGLGAPIRAGALNGANMVS